MNFFVGRALPDRWLPCISDWRAVPALRCYCHPDAQIGASHLLFNPRLFYRIDGQLCNAYT